MVYRIRPEKKGIAGKRPRTSPFQVSRILAKSEIRHTTRLYKRSFKSFIRIVVHFAWRINNQIMARTKVQKKEILDKVGKIADDSQSLVFVNFHGLKVSGATEVRRKLKSEGIGYFVAKKSITRKALEGKKITGTMPVLDGEVGIAYGTDLIAPAREIYAFQKKFKQGVSIVGGVFEGKFMTKAEMEGIALIPPLDTLRGMFLNVINSPIQGFVVALDQIAKKKTA